MIKITINYKSLKIFLFMLLFLCFNILFVNYNSSRLALPNKNCLSGVHTFYLYSRTSNSKIVTTEIKNNKCSISPFIIKGESIFVDNKNSESAINEYIEALLIKYKAKIQLVEVASYGKSEYYYSNKIPNYVIINGYRVNVHISISSYGITIGTPLIFGSF